MTMKDQNPQLTLELKEPRINTFYKIKRKLYNKYKIFESRKYIRNSYVWFFIITMTSLIFIQLYYILINQVTLPPMIPLLQIYIDLNKRLIPDWGIYLIPALSVGMLFTIVILTYQSFHKLRPLAIISMGYTLFATGLLTYSLLKLLSLYYL